MLDYTSSYQFALSTRAGVDCVALLCRLLTEEDENCVISSLDGIGAYDHVYRSAFFAELRADPELSAMPPFVRLWYGRQSHYTWTDDSGTDHRIPQGEGI